MSARRRSIRSRLVALLIVPLISLTALWAFAAYTTIGDGIELWAADKHDKTIGHQAQKVIEQLQAERKLSLIALSNPRDEAINVELTNRRRDLDRELGTYRKGAKEVRDVLTDVQGRRLDVVLARLDELPAHRTAVDQRTVGRVEAFEYYNRAIDSIFSQLFSLCAFNDFAISQGARSIVGLYRAQEFLVREDALVSAAIAAGRLTHTEHDQILQLIELQRFLHDEYVTELPTANRAAFARLSQTEPFRRLAAMENSFAASAREGLPLPIDGDEWRATFTQVNEQTLALVLKAADDIIAKVRTRALQILGGIAFAGILGTAALIVSILISVRITRSLITRLTQLRDNARDLAGVRLPDVVGRLRRGQPVDTDAEAPPLAFRNDELGEVGEAFNSVQRTAIAAAVEEANLRRGVNEVFLNIARRNQALLHRQLALLDRMERRTSEPEVLEDLFRVDHLATRMRRHAEDLVILAGAAPGRGWRSPVPVIDVIRGAISEVEEYARVTVLAVPDASITGRAVADMIHLLAELLENATSFSPPNTRVTVSGHLVPHGFAVEVEDRGLGMTPEAIAAANERLASPPDFDPTNSAQLGLFVVSQLAARHGVKIHLRPSPYGGVTAITLIPTDLVVAKDDVKTLPQRPDTFGVVDAEIVDPPVPRSLDPLRVPRPRPSVPASAHSATKTLLPQRPARQAPKAPPPSNGVAETEKTADGDLPTRVRQQSLAPQLRETPSEVPPEPTVVERTPEQLRTMMSSFQAGTVRGRLAAERGDDDQDNTASNGGAGR